VLVGEVVEGECAFGGVDGGVWGVGGGVYGGVGEGVGGAGVFTRNVYVFEKSARRLN